MNIRNYLAAFAILFSFVASFVQSGIQTIKLDQVENDFTIKSLTISEGDYVFEISNDGVDREVGFVLAPKGNTESEHHIKEAYLQKTIKKGETSSSKVVRLAKGEYEYFCPLNPTPHYKIIVE